MCIQMSGCPCFGQVIVVSGIITLSTTLLHIWNSSTILVICLQCFYNITLATTVGWVAWNGLNHLLQSGIPFKLEKFLFYWIQYKTVWDRWKAFYKPQSRQTVPEISSSTESLDQDEDLCLEIKAFVNNIITDFVRPWYNHTGSSTDFIFLTEDLLTLFFTRLLQRLAQCNKTQLLHKGIIILHLHYLEYLRAQRRSARRRRASKVSYSVEETQSIIYDVFKYTHGLASKQPEALKTHLRRNCMVLLKAMAPREFQESPASEFVSSIVSEQVLVPALNLLSSQMWLNRTFINEISGQQLPIEITHKKRIEINEPKHEPKPVFTVQHVPLRTPALCSALSTLISATAGPLLPEQASFSYQPQNKMWNSPTETKLFLNDISIVKSPSMPIMNINESKPSRPVLKRSLSITVIDDDVDVVVNNIPLAHSTENIHTSNETDNISADEEDFAGTIAKLKVLLEQRDSEQSLSSQGSKTSPFSTEATPFNFNNTNETSRDGSTESEQLEITEASEVPLDGRLFMNVVIPKTELISEPTNSQSKTYTTYCIEYDGIIPAVDMENGDSRMTLQHTLVRRRFSEFLALQSRLEENPGLNQHIKGVKGPSKWLQLPFSKMDQFTIQQRRKFLETYLQMLSGKVELTQSVELQEFLSYGEETSSLYMHKLPESSIPRIDRFLAKTMSGVFNTLKTALPGFDSVSPGSVSPNESLKRVDSEKKSGNWFSPSPNNSKEESTSLEMTFEPTEEEQEPLESSILHFLSTMTSLRQAMSDVNTQKRMSSVSSVSHLSVADLITMHCKESSESAFEDDSDLLDSRLILAGPLLDLMFDVLPRRGHWAAQRSVVATAKVLIGGMLEAQLKDVCHTYLSETAWIGYLRQLRNAIWFAEGIDVTDTSRGEATPQNLQQVIWENIPGILKWFIGPNDLHETVTTLVDLLQHKSLNLDLILSWIDILITDILTMEEQ